MRRALIAGNWKMNLNRAQSQSLAREVAAQSADVAAELVVCPPLVYLDAVHQVLDGSAVGLGAQNMYHEPQGAFTGEVSAPMLLDVGCQWVILGHSERRHLLGETDEAINRKLHAALDTSLEGKRLRPIVCVGELLEDRKAGRTLEVIRQQFDGSLANVTAEQLARLVIAYEPVWAIGTGEVATPEQAEEVHADLRKLVQDRYNAEVAESLRILYGGSVKPENAASLLSAPNIDGALVGGASLKADAFLAIAQAAPSN